jgi:3-oxoacyl-(acyl-carrier-protein) synthase
VITGIGVVAPNGVGTDNWWRATLEGRNAIRTITRFDASQYPVTLAGEVDGFEPSEHVDQRLMVQTDRWTWMALAATQMALDDAGFSPSDYEPNRMSVITASSSGGNEFGQREIQNLWGKGPIFVGAYQSIAWFYAATTGQISIKYGMKGECGVVVAEGAGGIEALAQSSRAIRRGVDVVVSGGTEAPIGPYALVCQLQSGALSEEEDPADAYRPFDKRANGYVIGEGGAILLVENLHSARERGAPRIYAEIVGHAATTGPCQYTSREPNGDALRRAIVRALERARVGADEIDVVFADAAGTQSADAAEAQALRDSLDKRGGDVPVTAPKTMVGRLYAGGAPLDVAAALLAMRDRRVPPTINVDDLTDGCELNLVRNSPLETDVNTALVTARGFGGFNSALVLRRTADDE